MTREAKPDDPGPGADNPAPTSPGNRPPHAMPARFTLPLLPLRNSVMFPNAMMPLSVGRARSINAVEAAREGNKRLAILAQKDPETDEPGPEQLQTVGTVVQIVKVIRGADGNLNVVVKGLFRFKVESLSNGTAYAQVTGYRLQEILRPGTQVEALTRTVKSLASKVFKLGSGGAPESMAVQSGIEAAPGSGMMADLVASHINFSLEDKQALLEEIDVSRRLDKLVELLNREIELLDLTKKIESKAKKSMDKVQRDYYLREQLKAIRRELGEEDGSDGELDELREKLDKAGLPPDARKEADREISRLSRISMASPEYTVARTYLECLAELPWNVSTEDNLDIANAKKVLDDDHYDLEKIKERILEYLAVRKLKKDMKGPILCFVGPPGVGKTSLGLSIARALGRKFIRMSLGGVKDEAEIRGHRRTYIGALPGRIIQGIRKGGSNNPVYMLDEIDKLGSDFRGDPSAALLEVLDPEQNDTFTDHYLDVHFDLSKVMFITTANTLDTVPPALKDRMEVIELPGYTELDKYYIARKFLVPKQITENGLTPKLILINASTIKRLISQYTRESGVRQLERSIAEICRKVAKKVADGKTGRTEVGAMSLPDLLGPQKHFPEMAERESEPGVATALAWTPAGGEILFIEITRMSGKGELILTGSLGEVMKESAQAAMTYVKSRAAQLGVDPAVFESNDLHIHVPAGAVPKDGPSTGIAVFVALVSLLTGRPARKEVAMTGEVTLRGTVLPVGGIKQKILAAHRAGITDIILPRLNENDLIEIPAEVKSKLIFHKVSKMEQVLSLAFELAPAVQSVSTDTEENSEKPQPTPEAFPGRPPDAPAPHTNV
ncbi:MAG TPA: endopeptidase La [Candidatus Brocadiia bacterium]|nr:endopeptidase La [Candidatus Brocadiia bacterium]